MMSHREAAKHWGVSRATIQRAAASGRLSLLADRTIDPAEMVRVFGEPPSHPEPPRATGTDTTRGHPEPGVSHPEPGGEPGVSHPEPLVTIPREATPSRPEPPAETTRLRLENEHLRTMLAEKDARIDDLRVAMRLLTDQRPVTPVPAPPPIKTGFWSRLKGR